MTHFTQCPRCHTPLRGLSANVSLANEEWHQCCTCQEIWSDEEISEYLADVAYAKWANPNYPEPLHKLTPPPGLVHDDY